MARRLTFDQWVAQNSEPIGPVPGPADYLKMRYGVVHAELILMEEYQKYLSDDDEQDNYDHRID